MEVGMRSAPEIKVQDVPQAAFVRTWILRRVKKLAARHPDITKLRVAVDTPHRKQSKGRQFRVQIDIGVPGSELVACNQPTQNSEKLIPALHEVFHRSERQLEEYRTARRNRDRRRRPVSIREAAEANPQPTP
jgi:ribosome-associated translation inhibitor RaiA